MKTQRKNLYLTGLFFVAAAQFMGTAAQATVLEINGTCQVGSCSTVMADAITSGTTIPVTPFSITYTTANTDRFGITGTFTASYGSAGSLFGVTLDVKYLGNSSTGVSQGDTLTVDFLQDIFDSGPGTFNGTYTEVIPLAMSGTLGSGSNVSGQLLWDGQSIGVVGPLVGDGSLTGTKSANLTGLTGNYLSGDFNFVVDFAQGTMPGAQSIVSNSVPEPAETIPVALVIGAALILFGNKKLKAFYKGAN
jgi:hypothetical protein